MSLIVALPLLAAAPPSRDQQVLTAAAPFIDRANDDWTRAIVSGDADLLSAPYDKDAVFVGPDGTAIHGRLGVRTMYARRPPGVQVVRASIRSDGRAAADADDVYEWGSAHMTVRHGGKAREVVGRYLTVWHRAGKDWLISHNIAF
jgi:ketosteroid isomerase-like protein